MADNLIEKFRRRRKPNFAVRLVRAIFGIAILTGLAIASIAHGNPHERKPIIIEDKGTDI